MATVLTPAYAPISSNWIGGFAPAIAAPQYGRIRRLAVQRAGRREAALGDERRRAHLEVVAVVPEDALEVAAVPGGTPLGGEGVRELAVDHGGHAATMPRRCAIVQHTHRVPPPAQTDRDEDVEEAARRGAGRRDPRARPRRARDRRRARRRTRARAVAGRRRRRALRRRARALRGRRRARGRVRALRRAEGRSDRRGASRSCARSTRCRAGTRTSPGARSRPARRRRPDPTRTPPPRCAWPAAWPTCRRARDEALDVLAALLGDRAPSVRAGAARAIGATGRRDASALVRYALTRDERDDRVLQALAETLLELQPDRGAELLATLLPEGDLRAGGRRGRARCGARDRVSRRARRVVERVPARRSRARRLPAARAPARRHRERVARRARRLG